MDYLAPSSKVSSRITLQIDSATVSTNATPDTGSGSGGSNALENGGDGGSGIVIGFVTSFNCICYAMIVGICGGRGHSCKFE